MTAPNSPTEVGSLSSPGTKPPGRATASAVRPFPPMAGSWLANQGRLPLAFMLLGLGWLGVATAMLALSPGVLALSHAAPAVVALTHAWVLGVFVSVATGAIYQIAPVALGTTLWHERLGWWHLALQSVSIPGMVVAFTRWDMALLAPFALAFAAGIGLFAVNTWKTVRKSGRRDAVAWSLQLAALWLLTTVMVGILAAANRLWYFLPLDPILLLRAHAHLGLGGFFLTLLQGVTFRLVPMFTLGDVPDWRPVRLGLRMSQLGLITLAPALLLHWNLLACFCAVFVFAGMLASAHALRRTLATRKKRFLDPGLHAFLAGCGALLLAPILGLLLLWPASSWDSNAGGHGAMPYAVALLVGGLLPVIAGMLCKVIPFLTWMIAYGPRVGRTPTPAAGALAFPSLERLALGLQWVAVVPLFTGAWTQEPWLLHLGSCLLAVGVALFVSHAGLVLRHLWAPRSSLRLPHPTP